MKDKVIVIIPAHNEAENIGKVIDDVKTNLDFADILVIDDYSTDNTKEIADELGVLCIRSITNLGYAMAIQTGIKYASYHNYEYVIQMDADGQHLASEAAKLYDRAKQTNADIVIGSRYLKKKNYKAPFFRRFGTKIFKRIIRLLCHQNITDPLSGLQCLNKKAIDYYAIPGNYPEYPDANLIIDMLMRGYKIQEVSVKMNLRENGKSMHAGILKPIRYMSTQLYACIVIFIKNIGKRRSHE